MREFTLKESDDFRIRVKIRPCESPDNLYCVEFIQEILKEKQVVDLSTYQFFLTEIELNMLSDRINKNDY